MPKTKTQLTPTEYAVLGLVRQKPTYGYELQRHLAGNQGLARVCPVEPAMVYAVLKSLAGLNLIEGTWESSGYPPRTVYTATTQGITTFERWLHSPVGRMREVRLDFMLKLYFSLHEDAAPATHLVERQLAATRAYADEIVREQTELGDGAPMFDAIVLASKSSAARITIA